MNKLVKWALIATVVCCVGIFSYCGKSDEIKVETLESTELLRTDESWNGEKLPDYPQGRPELVAVKYVIPAGEKLGWHHHVCINHGVLVQGELTIIGLDGKEKTLREGEVVVEMVDSVHYGENRGKKPVVLYMFYLAQKEVPLSVKNPEIPME